MAGSGKSTLVNQVLPKYYPEAVFIDQGTIGISNRSNLATYTGIFDVIRSLFAQENRMNASLFSLNSQGACLNCKGLGVEGPPRDIMACEASITGKYLKKALYRMEK